MQQVVLSVLLMAGGWLVANNAVAVQLHMIGDSTMAVKVAQRYPETGWGQPLGVLATKQIRVNNYAVNGRSSKSFIDEQRWQKVKAAFKPGDYLVVQFGHNDAKHKDPKRFTRPFEEYTQNLTRFVVEANKANVQPILVTSIVRRKFDESGVLIDTHKEYLIAVRQLAKSLNVPLVDLEQLTRGLVVSAGVSASKAYFLHGAPGQLRNYPDGVKDNSHLSDHGALMTARLFVRGLKQTGSPLAQYF